MGRDNYLNFGTEHAWCAKAGDTQALDPTWEVPGDAYIGVPFDPEWRRQLRRADAADDAAFIGRALLEHGLSEAARIDAGLAIPDTQRWADIVGAP